MDPTGRAGAMPAATAAAPAVELAAAAGLRPMRARAATVSEAEVDLAREATPAHARGGIAGVGGCRAASAAEAPEPRRTPSAAVGSGARKSGGDAIRWRRAASRAKRASVAPARDDILTLRLDGCVYPSNDRIRRGVAEPRLAAAASARLDARETTRAPRVLAPARARVATRRSQCTRERRRVREVSLTSRALGAHEISRP